MESTLYTNSFFADIRSGARVSAQEIAPLVLDAIPCKSVVDVGCAECTWLRVFKELGITDVAGFDGDYVDRNALEIDAKEFHVMDLSAPPKWSREYDLALSLEVAEHLPAAASDRFVEFLVHLAQAVLFSAAIPDQGGTNHVNEQWPEYWVTRFQSHGFVAIDFIREAVWKNEKVERWYAQNMLLFVRQDLVSTRPILQQHADRTALQRLSLVHPRSFALAQSEIRKLHGEIERQSPENLTLGQVLRLLARVVRNGLKRRLKF